MTQPHDTEATRTGKTTAAFVPNITPFPGWVIIPPHGPADDVPEDAQRSRR
jgi:hypothetical protein